jgi:hypothetical protein
VISIKKGEINSFYHQQSVTFIFNTVASDRIQLLTRPAIKTNGGGSTPTETAIALQE